MACDLGGSLGRSWEGGHFARSSSLTAVMAPKTNGPMIRAIGIGGDRRRAPMRAKPRARMRPPGV